MKQHYPPLHKQKRKIKSKTKIQSLNKLNCSNNGQDFDDKNQKLEFKTSRPNSSQQFRITRKGQSQQFSNTKPINQEQIQNSNYSTFSGQKQNGQKLIPSQKRLSVSKSTREQETDFRQPVQKEQYKINKLSQKDQQIVQEQQTVDTQLKQQQQIKQQQQFQVLNNQNERKKLFSQQREKGDLKQTFQVSKVNLMEQDYCQIEEHTQLDFNRSPNYIDKKISQIKENSIQKQLHNSSKQKLFDLCAISHFNEKPQDQQSQQIQKKQKMQLQQRQLIKKNQRDSLHSDINNLSNYNIQTIQNQNQSVNQIQNNKNETLLQKKQQYYQQKLKQQQQGKQNSIVLKQQLQQVPNFQQIPIQTYQQQQQQQKQQVNGNYNYVRFISQKEQLEMQKKSQEMKEQIQQQRLIQDQFKTFQQNQYLLDQFGEIAVKGQQNLQIEQNILNSINGEALEQFQKLNFNNNNKQNYNKEDKMNSSLQNSQQSSLYHGLNQQPSLNSNYQVKQKQKQKFLSYQFNNSEQNKNKNQMLQQINQQQQQRQNELNSLHQQYNYYKQNVYLQAKVVDSMKQNVSQDFNKSINNSNFIETNGKSQQFSSVFENLNMSKLDTQNSDKENQEIFQKQQVQIDQYQQQNQQDQIIENGLEQNKQLIKASSYSMSPKQWLSNPNQEKKQQNSKLVKAVKKIIQEKRPICFLGLEDVIERMQKNENINTDKYIQYLQRAVMAKDFFNILNYSNNMIIQNPQIQGHFTYKAWIGRGNNGVLVRNVLKNRWWWTLADKNESWQDVNFLWMQWRRSEYIKYMQKNDEVTESIVQYEDNIDECKKEQQAYIKIFQQQQKLKKNNQQQQQSKQKRQSLSIPEGSPRVKSSGNQNLLEESKKNCMISNKNYEEIKNYYKKRNPQMEYPLVTTLDSNSQYTFMNINQKQKFTKYKACEKLKLHNHIGNNYHLSNKNALLHNMRQYYDVMDQNVFDYLPLTFHIKNGIKDPEYQNFLDYYKKIQQKNQEEQQKKGQQKNIWIIKPGEASNRGNGIQVCQTLNSIENIIKTRQLLSNGKPRTYIIQKYIEKPLLYNKRKFDIRCFFLITYYNNCIKGYWYDEGYIRTSCREFSLKNLDNKFVHLTNDAVQAKSEDFGKYENGNKINFNDFQKYLDSNGYHVNFMEKIYPVMKKIGTDSIKSVFNRLEPQKKTFSFELFGLDFMIDDNFKTWLIEVNENPCLATSGTLLGRLMPQLIEQTFRVAVDPIFPPPNWPKTKKHMIPDNIQENNKFELVFDSLTEGQEIIQKYDQFQKNKGINEEYQQLMEEEVDRAEYDEDEEIEEEDQED